MEATLTSDQLRGAAEILIPEGPDDGGKTGDAEAFSGQVGLHDGVFEAAVDGGQKGLKLTETLAAGGGV